MQRLVELGVRYPVMQVGMPAIAAAELTSAVAIAGGIGTLGLTDESTWELALLRVKKMASGHPFCVNLLLPMTRPRHIELILEQAVPMATLFWGEDAAIVRELKDGGVLLFQQVGSEEEAKRVWDLGVDFVIAQGVEAGGHVRGRTPLATLLPRIAELGDGRPVFASGGINTETDARRARELGASGVSSGTRFLLTPESRAHDGYKERLLGADRTILTDLFGATWYAPHRVVPNAATERWCGSDDQSPDWLAKLHRATEPLRRRLPMKPALAGVQRVGIPFFTPSHPIRGHHARSPETMALYAGEGVRAIDELRPAAEVVEELARAFAH